MSEVEVEGGGSGTAQRGRETALPLLGFARHPSAQPRGQEREGRPVCAGKMKTAADGSLKSDITTGL